MYSPGASFRYPIQMKKNNNSNSQNKNKKNKAGTAQVQRIAPAVAYGVSAKVTVPRISQSRPTDSIKIRRKEFVGSITNGASTGFSVVPLCSAIPGYDLNPGCAVMFPWLSNMAGSFERFRFNRISIHIIPSQATSTAGRYYCAIDYDYDDAVPNSKVALMGNRTASEAPVWQELRIDAVPAELHRDMPAKYVSLVTRNNYIEARTAYCGFVIFAMDTPTANLLFDVWVEYDVDLISPVNDTVILQDAWTPYSPTTTANATVAVGTAYGGFNLFPGVSIPGALKVVVGGTPGVPTLAVPLGGATFSGGNQKAIDLAGAGGSGKLDINWQNIITGATPSATIGTNGFNIGVQAFDSNGTSLAEIASVGSGLVKQFVGIKDTSADMLTAGSGIWSTVSLYLNQLMAAYPTTRYLVPFVKSTAALGAGSSLCGYKFEL